MYRHPSPKAPPPLLTLKERNQLMIGPLSHFEFVCNGGASTTYLRTISALLNIGTVAACSKKDETKENIFLRAQACIVLIASRTKPEEQVVMFSDEKTQIWNALRVMDQWLTTLPRARLYQAVAQINKRARVFDVPP